MRFAEEALAAYKRWRQMNPEGPHPVVRVQVSSGQSFYFNGLAVAPAGVSTSSITLSSAGLNAHTLVVHDADLYLVEIEPVAP
jgi:hypothetical protein